jgi:hypothetical protein
MGSDLIIETEEDVFQQVVEAFFDYQVGGNVPTSSVGILIKD